MDLHVHRYTSVHALGASSSFGKPHGSIPHPPCLSGLAEPRATPPSASGVWVLGCRGMCGM